MHLNSFAIALRFNQRTILKRLIRENRLFHSAKIFYRDETAVRPQTSTDGRIVTLDEIATKTFTKSDRFQLPAGASSATTGNLQIHWNCMQFFVADGRGITDLTRYRVTARVRVTVCCLHPLTSINAEVSRESRSMLQLPSVRRAHVDLTRSTSVRTQPVHG